MGKRAKYDLNYFINLIELKNGKCLSDNYRILSDILEIECENKHKFKIRASSLLKGTWCCDCFYDKIRIPFDQDFFSRDNEESFYWAGFMAADGFVIRSSGYNIGLRLAIKDAHHLVKLKNMIKFEGDIKYEVRYNEILPNGNIDEICEMVKLNFSSKKTFNDLQRFNIFQNKTYTYSMPQWLIKHSLVYHFMRGYVDGDGCFGFKYNKSNRLPQLYFRMRGTAVTLQQMHNIFYKNNITNIDREVEAIDGTHDIVFGVLQYSGNVVMDKMYDFLYKDATVYLERKKRILKDVKYYRMNGTGKKRQVESKCGITKDKLLEKFKELKIGIKVAEYFGCTTANISFFISELNIKDEILKIQNEDKLTDEQIFNLYNKLGTYKKITEKYGISKYIISKALKKIENNFNI